MNTISERWTKPQEERKKETQTSRCKHNRYLSDRSFKPLELKLFGSKPPIPSPLQRLKLEKEENRNVSSNLRYRRNKELL
ncbi:MAG: hypothetical protein V7L14_24055 [Nostoc sp.]|uniref:hypothetical protein n=1 Tax=Nostoc sp. TaxID=1180 RepID=UPI002FF93589